MPNANTFTLTRQAFYGIQEIVVEYTLQEHSHVARVCACPLHDKIPPEAPRYITRDLGYRLRDRINFTNYVAQEHIQSYLKARQAKEDARAWKPEAPEVLIEANEVKQACLESAGEER